ncbi:hypothetical protein SSS_02258 [Sarcoptes scabiei]|nr:hypothetical protein SSS_02258 [Sarcoptes scabiei]
MLIRQLLSKCGTVHNWKRIQGPNGKLQAFGFCDYTETEYAMRAIRLLNDFQISDKKLIIRLGNKNQSNDKDLDKDKNNETEEMLAEDQIIKNQLITVLKEHEIELSKDPELKIVKRFTVTKDVKNEDLADMDIEDDKRNLIHREIDKFRDTYKKYDEEKEEEKRKKEEEKSRRIDRKDRESKRSRSRDRDDRNRSNRDRKNRDREKDRRSDRHDRRSPSFEEELERDRSESPVDEEELFFRRKRQEQIREKEISYQRRLRDWESREKRKAKDYSKERQKEIKLKKEEEIERQKLKQFLQDYDDDKHDKKFYSGKAFEQRLFERRKEIDQDSFERQQEQKELEELRKKLSEKGHLNTESESQKQMMGSADGQECDQLSMDELRSKRLISGKTDSDYSQKDKFENKSIKTFGFAGMKIAVGQNQIDNSSNIHLNETEIISSALDSTSDAIQSKLNHLRHQHSHSNQPNQRQQISKNEQSLSSSRKKLTVSDVFNANDDDEQNSLSKKRRPPPNALLEDNTDSNLSSISTSKTTQLSQEDKRIQIKNLIDTIPTSKNLLFNYVVDWDQLDDNLMDRRIRPWICKKIKDYIGEEEETLLDFICNKILSKSSAQSLLEDVAMVLDDEAQVFVVKLWRLLIYEIEAKKLGLTK